MVSCTCNISLFLSAYMYTEFTCVVTPHAGNVAEHANSWWLVSVPGVSENSLSTSGNWGAQCSYFGAYTCMTGSLIWEGILTVVSQVVLADSSVTSTVYHSPQCLVRNTWMSLWEITSSSALAGQALVWTPGVKLVHELIMIFSACWSCVREGTGDTHLVKVCSERSVHLVLPDLHERRKKLDYLFHISVGSSDRPDIPWQLLLQNVTCQCLSALADLCLMLLSWFQQKFTEQTRAWW